MKFTTLAFIACVIVVMSSLASIKADEARGSVGERKGSCVVAELKPCLQAVQTGSQPSAQCCGKLKEQESCLCSYSKDPRFTKYSGSAKNVLAACGVPFPSC